jgi:hypothetical protein
MKVFINHHGRDKGTILPKRRSNGIHIGIKVKPAADLIRIDSIVTTGVSNTTAI